MRLGRRDAAVAADLDLMLDAATTSVLPSVEFGEEARDLARTAQRLRSIGNLVADSSRTVQIGSFDAIFAQENAQHQPWPRLIRSGSPAQSRWRVDFGGVATAAVLLLTLLGGFVVFASDRAEVPLASDPAVKVYRTAEDGLNLVPIDPETLLDLPNPSPLVSATPDLNWSNLVTYVPDPNAAPGNPGIIWQASADGSTLVVFVPAFPMTANLVMVYDLPGGRLRSQFEAPSLDGVVASLSRDGGRLLVGTVAADRTREWEVIDTQDGHVIQTLRAGLSIPAPLTLAAQLDPSGERIYVWSLADADDFRRPGLWPIRLTVFDVVTGTAIETLDLPDVRAGYWLDEDDPLHQFVPALAISPDGRRLAIVDGTGATVTIVETVGLLVERTIELSPETVVTPVEDQVGGSEPVREGSLWLAWFDSLGERVIVSGWSGTETEREVCYSIPGPRIVEVDSGIVSDPGIGGVAILTPQPVGNDLYLWILGTDLPRSECEDATALDEPLGYSIVRVDPYSLAPEATRSFDGIVQVVVISSPE